MDTLIRFRFVFPVLAVVIVLTAPLKPVDHYGLQGMKLSTLFFSMLLMLVWGYLRHKKEKEEESNERDE